MASYARAVGRPYGSLQQAAASIMADRSVPLQFLKIDAKMKGGMEYPPVIVLHGLMASSATYRNLLKRPEFAPKRDIYALDLRNHGASPHHDQNDYESMAADVRRFMDAVDMQQACFLGHSLGGKVAMTMALDTSEKVSELIVIDIAPQQYQAPPEEDRPTIVALRAMLKTDLKQLRSREQISNTLKNYGVSSQRLRDFLLTNLIPDRERPGYFKWRLNLKAIAQGLPDLLSFPQYDQSRKFFGKTLFIKGGLSEVVTDAHRSEIMRLFPAARIESIQDAGHWVQADAPDKFCKTINNFLHD
eukprot:Plantae.Rhodophyta-Purpureofilum_apyrenoidigerum.ctg4812.p1 GENE.Plantae.Rhodophyta-Purpureofilum_apyrenoidigerum.ctg4812~~Plantae.Rhodophyta-Purpureofilum_apyrenoidigerum.ctg4812.p1  ORF type:complete len:302 (-),score=44.64 Plantae.Rhodophyta-Purpureofilum_apyrenoidigerum.ctg4812:183-1088(-)